MPADPFAPGDELLVTDAGKTRDGRKPPFAQGATVVVSRVGPAGLILRGHGGFWSPARFSLSLKAHP